MLIAIEGIDQAGKATQAELLFRHIQSLYQPTTLVSFPDYKTTIGGMIRQALEDDFDWRPKPLQLLCAANRFERQAEIEKWLAAGIIVVCDRYIASGIALRRRTRSRDGMADQDPPASTPTGLDDPARHQPKSCRTQKDIETRRLRTQSRASGRSQNQLPARRRQNRIGPSWMRTRA